jgi:sulfide:quinone oxidoreductase
VSGAGEGRRVLIAGAGIAALEAVMALRHLAGARLTIDLLAPTHEVALRSFRIAEPFGGEKSPRLPLGKLLRDLDVGHVFARLASVDPEQQVVHGSSGDEFGYDALLVAIGARPVEGLTGALTFEGASGVAGFRQLLDQLRRGEVKALTFAAPTTTAWTLPLYELALLTDAWLFERRVAGAQLNVVTSEAAPLAAFGARASETVAKLLEERDIPLRCGAQPREVRNGTLRLADGTELPVDRVVALPRLLGPAITGLPNDEDGFVGVDRYGRVGGVPNVYAAGDVTTWPIKQGGLAAQQADVAAESLAAWAGAPVRPSAFQPVLRGVLMTGDKPTFLRADARPHHTRSLARLEPLWWPPAKVAGRYLAPYLAAHGVAMPWSGQEERAQI